MTQMMHILSDNHIPLARALFSPCGEFKSKQAQHIRHHDCQSAHILLTRTTLKVNEALLRDTPVQFVASASAGIDHLDTAWLDANEIKWAHAPGCNANAVAEYVLCCVAALRQNHRLLGSNLTAAIIGVGQCGQRVANKLRAIGFEVMLIDPIRAEQESDFVSAPLSALRHADLVSLHVPLTTSGAFATHHLIHDGIFDLLKPHCVLINSSRGAVVDPIAAIQQQHVTLCFDVFENEPDVNTDLISHCTIATPHIAGYSKIAKTRATYQIYNQAASHFHWPAQTMPTTNNKLIDLSTDRQWESVALNTFNPASFREKLLQTDFARCRHEFVLKNEFTSDLLETSR